MNRFFLEYLFSDLELFFITLITMGIDGNQGGVRGIDEKIAKCKQKRDIVVFLIFL